MFGFCKKSLQGLSSPGAETFDELGGVAEMLGDNGQGMAWVKRVKDHLKSAKRYLKTDYMVKLTTGIRTTRNRTIRI